MNKNRILNVLLILFVIISAANFLYAGFKPRITAFINEIALSESKQKVTECVAQKESELHGKKVIGLDFTCAIEVASDVNASDKEKSLQICMAYNPLTPTNEVLARTTCTTSIERKLREETKTAFASADSNTTIAQNSGEQKAEIALPPNVCTMEPTSTEIGRDQYPIDAKYKDIKFLGQLFTAYNCGASRLGKIFGVTGDSYTLGSTIWLENSPSQPLIDTFKSVGFACGEKTSDADCKKWRLTTSVKVEDLMKLEPYYKNFRSDDCINCG